MTSPGRYSASTRVPEDDEEQDAYAQPLSTVPLVRNQFMRMPDHVQEQQTVQTRLKVVMYLAIASILLMVCVLGFEIASPLLGWEKKTDKPSPHPTLIITSKPTTRHPTWHPTRPPSAAPSRYPSSGPSAHPSTLKPSRSPSPFPSISPSFNPVTQTPTLNPVTSTPTSNPHTLSPSAQPTTNPQTNETSLFFEDKTTPPSQLSFCPPRMVRICQRIKTRKKCERRSRCRYVKEERRCEKNCFIWNGG